MVALFGVVGTSRVLGVLPYLAEARLPLIAVYTGSPAIPRAQASPTFSPRAQATPTNW